MSSSPPSGAAGPLGKADEIRLRNFLESKGLEFQIRTGNNKWKCVVQDRATYEKTKAALESKSTTVTTPEPVTTVDPLPKLEPITTSLDPVIPSPSETVTSGSSSFLSTSTTPTH
ncbi:hypothetical protein QBC37DRAFT_371737 [Rhypophila decipiens]|uniref:Uncharacterized protein n=1 Tax=Rhypophila decipiens TaxID=261697 RepID=A0AAN6YD33_9PEZI|nr:hypothetical protein QBC37DRAFT_371737 [Rhypophila decipiens]